MFLLLAFLIITLKINLTLFLTHLKDKVQTTTQLMQVDVNVTDK